MVDLVEHSEHFMSCTRRNKAELDARCLNSVPFNRIDANPLEKSVAHIYTPEMFKRERDCIWRSSAWEIAEQSEVDGFLGYEVVLKDGEEGGEDLSSL